MNSTEINAAIKAVEDAVRAYDEEMSRQVLDLRAERDALKAKADALASALELEFHLNFASSTQARDALADYRKGAA